MTRPATPEERRRIRRLDAIAAAIAIAGTALVLLAVTTLPVTLP